MSETSRGLELNEPVSPEALIPDIGLWPWFAAAALLLVLLIAVMLLLKLRRTKGDPLAARNAAFAEARSALETARPANPRDAAVQVSLILRRYLSIAAGDPALYETHEEFISRHDALAALTPETRAAAEAAFSQLAANKYAPEAPASDPADIIGQARVLLDNLHRGFAA